MHQIVCRLGLCPRPTGGVYIAPPDSLAGLGVGPTGNGKEGGEGKRREGRKGREGGEGVPECPNPELASLLSRTPGRRAACAAGRLDGAYWLMGPGSAQGCRCALPLQAWAGPIVAAARLQLVYLGLIAVAAATIVT